MKIFIAKIMYASIRIFDNFSNILFDLALRIEQGKLIKIICPECGVEYWIRRTYLKQRGTYLCNVCKVETILKKHYVEIKDETND